MKQDRRTSDGLVGPDGRSRACRAAASLVIVALALVMGACGSSTDTREIAIATVGGTAGFQPDTITVSKGGTVVMTVTNSTDREHGFSIAGYPVQETVAPGATVEVRFPASRAGSFRIFCQLHDTHQPATLSVR